jgi:hypothetical protein
VIEADIEVGSMVVEDGYCHSVVVTHTIEVIKAVDWAAGAIWLYCGFARGLGAARMVVARRGMITEKVCMVCMMHGADDETEIIRGKDSDFSRR